MCRSGFAAVFMQYVPDAVLDAGDSAVKQTQSLPSKRGCLIGKVGIEQECARCLKEKTGFCCFAF